MKYKLIAIDLDGTLLNSQGEIDTQTQQIIRSIASTTNIILTTGRHHTTVAYYHQLLQLNTPAICCNGSYVYQFENQQITFAEPIDKQRAAHFVSQSESLDLIAYADDKILLCYQHPANYISKLESWGATLEPNIQPKIERVTDFASALSDCKHIWTFVTEGSPNDIDAFISDPLIYENFSYEQSWFNRIGFNKKGNSKGAMLSRLATSLGIKLEDVVAIGDNDNDVSMLQCSGLGIAVNNATEKLKNCADIVTKASNDQNAIVEAIKIIS